MTTKGLQIYRLDLVAAADGASVALVTSLQVRSRGKESEGKESEDTGEHFCR
jgi:hypothetical protein